MKSFALFAACIALAAAPVAAHAGSIASGFNANTMAACDDCFSNASALGFSIDFFGKTYSSAFVSNNGYVTFGSGQGVFTPSGLTGAYTGAPIMAPFFADVYTRNVGTVTYGTGSYAGRSAFGVTWSGVAGFGLSSNLTNTFQEIIVGRADIAAGDADIYFNYGQIKWDTGSYSDGTSAAAGYANGTGVAGSYAQIAGSLTPGAFLDNGANALSRSSNDGIAGQYLFQLRNGVVTAAVAVPEPGMLSVLGLGLTALGLLRRRSA